MEWLKRLFSAAEGWEGGGNAKRRHECRRGTHECVRHGTFAAIEEYELPAYSFVATDLACRKSKR